jgi:orotidine-5'-phosphate decarboxylase
MTHNVTMKAKDKMFVALDVETPEQALKLVQELGKYTRMFKIGSRLFTKAGPDLVREIVALDAKIFLDLKFHDIPNTVAAASAEAARLGVYLFTVHAVGGRQMMFKAVEATSAAAEKSGRRRPLIVGVTVLTSADAGTLREIGVERTVEDQVAALATLCAESGLDGVVASPHEVRLVRTSVAKSDFLVVTPGVRLSSDPTDDQKRVMSPAEAIKAGADYLVVGRPIIDSPDPAMAACRILEQIESALP